MAAPDPPPPPPPFECQLAFYPLALPPATLCEYAYHAHAIDDQGTRYPMGDVPGEIVVIIGTCVVDPGVATVKYDPVERVVVVTPVGGNVAAFHAALASSPVVVADLGSVEQDEEKDERCCADDWHEIPAPNSPEVTRRTGPDMPELPPP